MSRRRVLIVVNYFFPYISGVSECARAIARSLATQHDVTVLTGKHRPELSDQETCAGYRIVRAEPLFFLDKGYISFAFIRQFRNLSRKSDVVNLHLPMLESGLLSLLTAQPLLTTYHCDMAVVGTVVNRFAVLAVRLSMRLALKQSAKIVVLSRDYAMTSALLRSHQSILVEVPPPNRFDSDAPALSCTDDCKTLICGFVGRFVPEKGIRTIVESARQLGDEPIEFWLAGDHTEVAGGSIFESIREAVESLGGSVKILGRLSDHELKDFYRRIDILLLPSVNRFEAFGLVQLEAMTFGATVVTSDMPGVRAVVRRTGIGQLCDPDSADSLTAAIRRAKVERANISRVQVHLAVRREFGNEKFVDSYLSLIRSLAAV